MSSCSWNIFYFYGIWNCFSLLLCCFLAAWGSFFLGVYSGAGVNRGSWKWWSVNILECVLLHVKDCFSRLLGAAAEASLSQHTRKYTQSHEWPHTYAHPLAFSDFVCAGTGQEIWLHVDWNITLHSFTEYLEPHMCFSLTLMFYCSM